jgi:hypothetical protein
MDSLSQVRDDLAFVRRAVERQQRLRHVVLPWWFAGLIGVSILLRCIGIDHSPGLYRFVRENPPLTFLVPLWFFHIWRQRRKLGAGDAPQDAFAPTRADVWAFVSPWLVLLLGFGLLAAIGSRIEIPSPLQAQLLILLAGLTALHAGLAGATGLLYIGVALELGLLAFVFLSQNTHTVFGVLLLVGLVLGALHEERASERA